MSFCSRAPLSEKRRLAKNDATRRWAERNPEKRRMSRRQSYVKRKFGITFEERERLLSVSSCAFCGVKEHLVLDHAHASKIIRGVLCRRHNAALGSLGDTVESIERVLAYVRGRLC